MDSGEGAASRRQAGSQSPSTPLEESPVAVEHVEEIVPEILGHCLRLGEASAADARLQALSGLAGVLEAECFRAAGRPEPAGLQLLVRLYELVLAEGIEGQALALSVPERRILLPMLLERQKQSVSQARRLSMDAAPAVRASLERMSSATRLLRHRIEIILAVDAAGSRAANEAGAAMAAAAALAMGRSPADEPRLAATPTLAELVVRHGLFLLKEENPLTRAGQSNELALHFIQAILRAWQKDKPDLAARLGDCLEWVMDHGIAANLDRVPVTGKDDPQLAELERISRRAAAAATALEADSKRFPRSAPAGFWKPTWDGRERVLNAAKIQMEKCGKPFVPFPPFPPQASPGPDKKMTDRRR